MADPATVHKFYAVAPLGGVATAVLTAMNLATLGCEVGAIYFAVVVSSCIGSIVCACGLLLIRAIDGSLANSLARTVHRPGGVSDTSTRDEQDLRLLTTRKHIMRTVVALILLISLGSMVVCFGALTPYGPAAPIFFFAIPLGVVPAIWFEINIVLHGPKLLRMCPISRDRVRSSILSHMSHSRWSAQISALAIATVDGAKWRLGHGFGGEKRKGPAVLPTEEVMVCPMVAAGSDS